MITSICCSFYDSVPVVYLTDRWALLGNVGSTGVRQIGFQETPIVDLVEPITNCVLKLETPDDIRKVLEEAVFKATNGRNGPVVVDIPDNYQRVHVNPAELEDILSKEEKNPQINLFKDSCGKLLLMLKESSRPIIIGGQGVFLSKLQKNSSNLLSI